LVCEDGEMAWQPDAAFIEGLGFFTAAAAQPKPFDWERPSPCKGWRLLDVVGHVGAAVRFGTKLLREERPAWEPVEPPGAAVVGDPYAWWNELVDPARDAVSGVDLSRVVDSPMGARPIGQGLAFPAVDLFVHAWDVSRSAGMSIEIPDEAMEFARAVIGPIPAAQVRNQRVFGDELVAPQDATATESFIAWTGRNPRWSPSSSV